MILYTSTATGHDILINFEVYKHLWPKKLKTIIEETIPIMLEVFTKGTEI